MIDFQNANEIFDVYGIYPSEKGMQKMLTGRFLIQDGKLRILEDHSGLLQRSLVPGPVGHNLRQLNSLAHSPYTQVVSETEIKEGHHVDLVPKGEEPRQDPSGPQVGSPPSVVAPAGATPEPQDLSQEAAPIPKSFSMQTPPAVFDYMKTGMREPQVLEVRDNEVYMNGNKLSTREVERIMYTLETGLGKLRYRKKV